MNKLSFYLKAKNEHSLHSPFLYKFYCYFKKVKPARIHLEGIERSCPFDLNRKQKITLAKITSALTNLYEELNLEQDEFKVKYLWYFDASKELDLEKVKLKIRGLHNDAAIVFLNIHEAAQKGNREILQGNVCDKNWEKVQALDEIRTSIDFFQLGLCFKRSEMTRAHHLLRP